MALGLIIDPNSDHSAEDVYALVSSGIVVNTIEASWTDIQTIYASYDYSIDLNVQGQTSAGIGWSYDAGTDTFTAPSPPPFDWITQVEDDFDNIVADLAVCLGDAGASGGDLSPTDLATAYARSVSDSEDSFTENQLTLMNAIYAYILSGG